MIIVCSGCLGEISRSPDEPMPTACGQLFFARRLGGGVSSARRFVALTTSAGCAFALARKATA